MSSMSPGHPRPGLTRARIVSAALAVARTEGIAAASMRRIADDLHSSPMSLYRHVADREQLLLAMLDEVALGIDLPPPVPDPRAELTAVLTAAHSALRRDAWVVEILVAEGLASPHILPLVERIFTALERGGLTGPDVAAGYALLWHYVYGESIAHHHDRPDTFSRRMSHVAIAADPSSYPAIGRVMAVLPTTDRDFFAENLQRLLAGLLT